MELFNQVIMFLISLVANAVFMAVGIAILFIIVRIGWVFISEIWKMVHEPSFNLVDNKIKDMVNKFKNRKKKSEEDV
ncbi:hypothetical protein PQE75_gp124 [Bacillus phage vB_BcoS-136]|uniref:Uncharacterized protein n=1 Tax=Bacillus phage vB_BcoS-136 TaxID=2419619 RepID=A0A3G3BVR3_9CAUD|nr:hypothetical protein PQE75_gp124 [Bacillus phage vB_BcoS-136]AYP68355.1 hypothetical protein vBBcoS136_00241 [Bacillus phage vB_BcoS-136]